MQAEGPYVTIHFIFYMQKQCGYDNTTLVTAARFVCQTFPCTNTGSILRLALCKCWPLIVQLKASGPSRDTKKGSILGLHLKRFLAFRFF